MMAVLSGLAVLVEVTSERRRRCDGLAGVDVEIGRGQQQYSTRQTDESKRGEDLSNLPDWSLLQGPTVIQRRAHLSAHDGEANAASTDWSLARLARLCMQFRLPCCICRVMRGDLRARRAFCFLVREMLLPRGVEGWRIVMIYDKYRV